MRHEHVTPINDLPAQLRRLRKANRLTLKDVAMLAGLSLSFLSDVERGRTDPSLETLRTLASVYLAEIVVSFDGT